MPTDRSHREHFAFRRQVTVSALGLNDFDRPFKMKTNEYDLTLVLTQSDPPISYDDFEAKFLRAVPPHADVLPSFRSGVPCASFVIKAESFADAVLVAVLAVKASGVGLDVERIERHGPARYTTNPVVTPLDPFKATGPQPNTLTEKTLREVEEGVNLIRCENTDDMFRKLEENP